MHRRDFLRTSILSAAATTLSPFALKAFSSTSVSSTSQTFHRHAWQSAELSAYWVGHSTIVLQMFGKVIVCDPVFYREIGVHLLGTTVGIQRLQDAALRIDDLPRPDLVLLSHAHMDHMDLPSLEALCLRFPDSVECVCAKNTKDVIADLPWKNCRELDWWESLYFGELCISAVEVLHNGWRYPWEADRREGNRQQGRSYNAYVLSMNGKNVVFGGDTAFTESFRELRSIPISLALMPIGAYAGCSDNHCTPEEAVAMTMMMQAECIAPIHCLTFRQTPEPRWEPMQRFLSAANKQALPIAWNAIGSSWRIDQMIAQEQKPRGCEAAR